MIGADDLLIFVKNNQVTWFSNVLIIDEEENKCLRKLMHLNIGSRKPD